jgi:uncharacterized protein (TIGR02246 family)
MNSRSRYLPLAGAASLGLALCLGGTVYPPGQRLIAQQKPAAQPGKQAQPPVKPAVGPSEDAKQAIVANIRAFTEAYNRRDVMTLLSLFTDDCELTESDGTTLRGLAEVEAGLKEGFESDPDAKISVSIESLKQVTPDVIIEEGATTFYPDGKTLTAEADYQATHVKKGNRWLMTRVRSFNRVVLSPYDQLRDLEWLVGDWIDESSDSLVEASYRWDDNKAFLLQEFHIKIKGQKVLTGTQRIGRDPLTKQIKAWVFDSEGGYAESLWSNVDGAWVIKAKGVRADGQVVTVTNQITRLGKDRMSFQSADRIVGEERMPNMTVIAVRKPPQAKR